MRAPLLISLAAVLLAAGCDQKSNQSSSGTNVSGASGNPLDAPADYLRAVVKAQQTAVKTVDTASVQKAIQLFNVEEGRNPKDLNELVQKKYLPVLPEVPHGMKFVYDADAGTVKVVNQ